jgi:protease IV
MTDTALPSPAPFPLDREQPRPIKRYTTRQVFGGIWRVLVGIKDILALAFLLLFFITLAALLSGRPNAAAVFGTGALVLKLDGTISEQPAPVDPFAAFTGGMPTREFRRADLVRALEVAATDERVEVVVLDLDRFMGGGQVALGDVAEAIDKVRAANKPVLAYATAYGDDAYQLAAHASEVWTEQGGGVLIAGPGGSRLYYKGLMDRLGVTANVYKVGTFKSAIEPFTRSDQSPEAEEANLAYASVLWEQWQQQVSRARPRATLAAYIADPTAAMRANGNDLAAAAKAAGLIDRVGTRLAFETRVAAIAGASDDERPWKYDRIKLDDWVAAHPPEQSGERIAVIPVVGEIVDGLTDNGSAGGETIARHIFDAIADESVKAIVLRVDSPGGSVLASERIRSALLQAKSQRRLPIVVSMANVAASGGYWIATPADKIIAEPDTITGSIGVFAVLPSFETALANIGVGADGIATTPLSGQPDLFGGVNAEFDALAQASVEDIYGRFTGLVAASRRMPVARVGEIAEGRVWAGATARQLGLVDQFGGLDVAIQEAAKLARLDPTKVHGHVFEAQPDPFSQFFANMNQPGEDEEAAPPSGWFAQAAWLREARLAQALGDVRRLMGASGVQASCLECRDWLAPKGATAEERGVISRWLGW